MTYSPQQSKGFSARDVRLEDVSVSFDGTCALDGVTLHVEPGEQVAVIGASGAGKTTLFRVLTRSVVLSSGRVIVGGHDLYTLSKRELEHMRRRIGVVHQAYDLVPQLSAGINAALGETGSMSALGTLRTLLFGPEPGLSARTGEALKRLGLENMAGSRTANLSGGQQQRVAVARLLVQHPNLVLADEPFAAVDPVTTDQVMEVLRELNREGSTLLINLHDVEIARRFPRVVALREGKLVFDGPPEKLTGESLAGIYAGDPYAPEKDTPDSQDVLHCRENTIRTAEGRGGFSVH